MPSSGRPCATRTCAGSCSRSSSSTWPSGAPGSLSSSGATASAGSAVPARSPSCSSCRLPCWLRRQLRSSDEGWARGHSPWGTPPRRSGYLAVGISLLLDAPTVVVGGAAAAVSVAVTLTRPTHHALLPRISLTTGDLTVGNAASGTLEAVATFVGPLASGLLLAVVGSGGVLVVDELLRHGGRPAHGSSLGCPAGPRRRTPGGRRRSGPRPCAPSCATRPRG